jgi:hypothetical protein
MIENVSVLKVIGVRGVVICKIPNNDIGARYGIFQKNRLFNIDVNACPFKWVTAC